MDYIKNGGIRMKNQLSIKLGINLMNGYERVKNKAINFIKDEKSLKGTTEEGQLTFGNVVFVLIVIAIVSVFLTAAFTELGNQFMDGVTGKQTTPPGDWGTPKP